MNAVFLIARHFVEGNVYVPFLLFMCLCQRDVAFMCAYVSVHVQVSWHWRASSTLALLSVLILCMTCVCVWVLASHGIHTEAKKTCCVSIFYFHLVWGRLSSPHLHLAAGVLGWHTCATAHKLYVGSGNSDSGPQTFVESIYPGA